MVVTELLDSDGRRAKVVVAEFGAWRSVPASQGTRGRGLHMIGTLMQSHDVDQRHAARG